MSPQRARKAVLSTHRKTGQSPFCARSHQSLQSTTCPLSPRAPRASTDRSTSSIKQGNLELRGKEWLGEAICIRKQKETSSPQRFDVLQRSTSLSAPPAQCASNASLSCSIRRTVVEIWPFEWFFRRQNTRRPGARRTFENPARFLRHPLQLAQAHLALLSPGRSDLRFWSCE